MSTSFLGLTITPILVARSITLLITSLNGWSGCRTIADREGFAKSFGFPPGHRMIKTADADIFMLSLGARRIAQSVAQFLCLYFEYDKALAFFLLSSVLPGYADGMCLLITSGYDGAAIQYAYRKAYWHWGGATIAVLTGIAMFYYGKP